MRRTCEYYYWGDFKTEVLEYMFPNANHIELKEEGSYDFTVDVEDNNGDVETFTSTEIGRKWYLIDDMVEVYDFSVDNQGIYVIFNEMEV